VAGRLGVLRLDPFDLGLEQRDAIHQLVLRIGVERLAGQQARGVAARAWQIIVVQQQG
jgi:hypothetical protein